MMCVDLLYADQHSSTFINRHQIMIRNSFVSSPWMLGSPMSEDTSCYGKQGRTKGIHTRTLESKLILLLGAYTCDNQLTFTLLFHSTWQTALSVCINCSILDTVNWVLQYVATHTWFISLRMLQTHSVTTLMTSGFTECPILWSKYTIPVHSTIGIISTFLSTHIQIFMLNYFQFLRVCIYH